MTTHWYASETVENGVKLHRWKAGNLKAVRGKLMQGWWQKKHCVKFSPSPVIQGNV